MALSLHFVLAVAAFTAFGEALPLKETETNVYIESIGVRLSVLKEIIQTLVSLNLSY